MVHVQGAHNILVQYVNVCFTTESPVELRSAKTAYPEFRLFCLDPVVSVRAATCHRESLFPFTFCLIKQSQQFNNQSESHKIQNKNHGHTIRVMEVYSTLRVGWGNQSIIIHKRSLFLLGSLGFCRIRNFVILSNLL
jgi:hypothetical protein